MRPTFFLVRKQLRICKHCDGAATLAVAVLEGKELPDDIVRRQPGNVRRFRMTVARRQMTLCAGGPRTRAAGHDDLWHRRGLAPGPTLRVVDFVGLRPGGILCSARPPPHRPPPQL